MTPLLTPEEAAKELGIGVDTLADMRKSGELPYVNIGRGKKRETPRYDLDDLIAWKEANKKRRNPAAPNKGRRRQPPTSSSVLADFREALERRRQKTKPAKDKS